MVSRAEQLIKSASSPATPFSIYGGHRVGLGVAAGHRVAYDLFLPDGAFPDSEGARDGASAASEGRGSGRNLSQIAVILLHGFGGTRGHMKGHAERLAAAGIPSLTPEMTSLMRGGLETAQLRNIELIVQHADWLLRKVGARKLLFAGHSAGGAVMLEAALRLTRCVVGVVLLDAVPWPRTIRVLAEASPLPCEMLILCIRAEPGTWNRYGNVQEALGLPLFDAHKARGKLLDVYLRGSGHGDAMNPQPYPSLLLRLLSLAGDERFVGAFSDLLFSFVVDIDASCDTTERTFSALGAFNEVLTALITSGVASVK